MIVSYIAALFSRCIYDFIVHINELAAILKPFPMTRKFWIILSIILSFKALGQNKIDTVETVNVYNSRYDKLKDSLNVVDVLFEDLLKSPKQYKNKYIRVSGFVHLELPYCTIYKSEKEYINKEKSNVIGFVMHKEDSYVLSQKFNDKQSFVSGIFVFLESELFKYAIYRIQNVDVIK